MTPYLPDPHTRVVELLVWLILPIRITDLSLKISLLVLETDKRKSDEYFRYEIPCFTGHFSISTRDTQLRHSRDVHR